MWESIKYVSSALTLAAFVVAAVTFLLRTLILQRVDLIERAQPKDRPALVSKALGDLDIDTKNWSEEKQHDVAIKQIQRRAERFKWIAIQVLIFMLLAAAVALFALVRLAPLHTSVPTPAPTVRPTPTPTPLPLFPIVIPEQELKSGGGHYEHCSIQIGKDGNFAATIRTKNVVALLGYHGAVSFTILGEDGRTPIHTFESSGYGVDGDAIPGGKSQRTDTFTYVIPPDVLARIHSKEQIQMRGVEK